MFWLWLTPVVVGLDQLSKWWAENALRDGRMELLSWFDLRLAYNPGAAFSLLADAGGWQRYFFLAVGALAVVIILLWMRKLQAHERVTGCGLAFILGGALGNLIDRALYGHVIDFIDWHYKDWHWPAFNLADSAIFLGVVLVIGAGVFAPKQAQTQDKPT